MYQLKMSHSVNTSVLYNDFTFIVTCNGAPISVQFCSVTFTGLVLK